MMNLDAALSLLAQNQSAPLDLAELALALARDEHPSLDVEAYLAELDAMAREVRPRLRGGLQARTRALCRYLFDDMGFRGDDADYYNARNSYLNEVMDRRRGIPITLSAVAMAVGARAGLQVSGVGLPGHFVAKATADGEEALFDPYHGGRLLTPADCETLVRQAAGLEFEATPAALEAAPLCQVVIRMLTNLKGAYLRAEDFSRAVRVMRRLRRLSPDDVMQRRDLGATLMRIGEPGQAIDHLDAYLQLAPPGEDADLVRKLLGQARGMVARWN
ncbi:MAG TPA: transglutaminase-like domain-containing protein [Gemmataceae bacterium]|nr:transglutaminase-like domain-containing protein [Gemmataceae bacterium]